MYRQREVAAVVVAAGKSSRMGFDKLLHRINGVEVLRLTVERMAAHPYIDRIVVVAGENRPAVEALFAGRAAAKPLEIVTGGATRTDSVRAGVSACAGAALVAVHDGARPFVPADVITRTVEAAAETSAAAPGVPVKDTIKQVENGLVVKTHQRKSLVAIQTPQVFERRLFLSALAQLPKDEYAHLTDDCMVMERLGYPVKVVPGDYANQKITGPEDLPKEAQATPPAKPHLSPVPRVGHGYDVHRLVHGRELIMGGVKIPYEKGLLGHSDADVLLHAVADALLGAVALGDIGKHFPDSDPAYKGAGSLLLLKHVGDLLHKKGCKILNIDATLLCQAPKLAPYIPAMRGNIATALGIEAGRVSVKATTEERLGFTGSGEGIAAHCVAMVLEEMAV